jgi:hypothetical protein
MANKQIHNGFPSRAARNDYEAAQKRKRRGVLKRSPETWPTHIFYGIKYTCKKNRIPFNLSVDDIVVPEVCPVFGTPFVFGIHLHPRAPNVDRLRPALGYVKGNVRVISRRANLIKNDSVSSGEILAVARYMEREGL